MGARISHELQQEQPQETSKPAALDVSFEYQCQGQEVDEVEDGVEEETVAKRARSSGMFSCLSGAALGANATLGNTSMCNGIFVDEILPGMDSPHTFRSLPTSLSTPRLDSLVSSAPSRRQGFLDCEEEDHAQHQSAPPDVWLLSPGDARTAGGAAGEDRVQAVCSLENGWLFCGIYDGFNGRDAADYLAGTLYENIGLQLRLIEWRKQQKQQKQEQEQQPQGSSPPDSLQDNDEITLGMRRALAQTESDFMDMVQQEMEERPDLAMVGSCVLIALMHSSNLYTLNMGDSRAILATRNPAACSELMAVQLTETHDLDNDAERQKLLLEHPDDSSAIVGVRVKGKLKVTRAFGAGFLKMASMNDSLMGILRVRNLSSPPYISASPQVAIHRVCSQDEFVVLGSDGLFDFFSNDEVVQLVATFVCDNPTDDPAKFMLDQLMLRAAKSAGISLEHLKSIPIGRRRKYHDDVTIIVILLGRTSSACVASS